MSKRAFQAVISRALLVLAVAGLCLSNAAAQEKKVISGGQGLPFSDGIVVGNTLYIAGQQGSGEDGKLKAGGIGPETQAALENIAAIVKQAGFQLQDIVAVTVYVADIHDFAAMNKVYKSFLPDPKPTRTTVQAAALVGDARIEISAVAVKQK